MSNMFSTSVLPQILKKNKSLNFYTKEKYLTWHIFKSLQLVKIKYMIELSLHMYWFLMFKNYFKFI